jgi:CRP-like cAMP-binding protein
MTLSDGADCRTRATIRILIVYLIQRKAVPAGLLFQVRRLSLLRRIAKPDRRLPMLPARGDGKANFVCACSPGQEDCRGSALCQLGEVNGFVAGVRQLGRGERLPEEPNACMRFRVVRSGLVATCAVTPDGRR